MHGRSSGYALLANAEVDSMGGVIDGGVCVDSKTSPRRAAIEKAQAELRQEYDVREERRRELEFLEKGGNPLDFKPVPAISISLQSTSVTDQLGEQIFVSEAKGSTALPASPHGDSVDSSGRLGTVPSKDPSSAENLLIFDGEDEMGLRRRNSFHLSKRGSNARVENIPSLKESDFSTVFRLEVKGQAYARRNRSRSSRDSAHAYLTNLVKSGNGNVSSNVPSARGETKGLKGLCEETMMGEPVGHSVCNDETTSPNANVGSRSVVSGSQDTNVDTPKTHETKNELVEATVLGVAETRESENNECSQVSGEQGNGDTVLLREVGNRILDEPDCGHCGAVNEVERLPNPSNGCGMSNEYVKDMPGEVQNARDHDLDLDKSDAVSIVNEQNDISCLNPRKPSRTTNEDPKGLTSSTREVPLASEPSTIKEDNDFIKVEGNDTADNDVKAVDMKIVQELGDCKVDLQCEKKPESPCTSKPDERLDESRNDSTALPCSKGGHLNSLSPSNSKLQEPQESQNSAEKLLRKAHEDAILEKARTIEANRKRLAAVSSSSSYIERRKKSHWDFVLEEMAWLANDFMQERIWKIAAASRISHMVALTSRSNLNDEIARQKQKLAAHSLTKAVMQFWDSAKMLLSSELSEGGEYSTTLVTSEQFSIKADDKDKTEECNPKNNGCKSRHHILDYAIRFLKDNNKSSLCSVQAEAPRTLDRFSDSGILEFSENSEILEQNLFYTVPCGAMESYRRSVESLWVHYEKVGNGIQSDGYFLSLLDSPSGALENAYEEDEGDTGMYYLPGPGDKFSKSAQKKRKKFQKYMPRSYDMESELPYGNFVENKSSNQLILPNGKRPSSTLHVGSIPTKRVRTAARPRVLGPSTAVPAQMTTKTDVSSGDTSSFQDDQSSLHGGCPLRKNSEVESTGEYGKQFLFDGAEVSPKHKKKKKSKHLGYKNSFNSADSATFVLSARGSAYDHRWQGESTVQHEQREISKRKLDGHHFDSNANTGTYGQHNSKKIKLLKHQPDISPEVAGPVAGSTPSVTSQLSNMANSNKFMKVIANRGPGRKTKVLKLSAGSSGAGGPWSDLEDQALVVLVHDMGPNWELVSDAMNSTLHFKCIFRMPKECKERHKILMDRNSGDGADSAEDSGSSQPYPSTLPGIPKGSARQLFQRLQGPLEEDMLKAHFEKIIDITQQLHLRRSQIDSQEAKQITPIHGSHVISLSQVCPNNLNGSILTPLDLCDATTSSPDVLSLGYPGPHAGGVAVPSHQGSLGSSLASSIANNMTQGSSAMILGNGLTPTSAAVNLSSRDAHRYVNPRSVSLPMDEQQRIQQYNQMMSSRNVQQTNLSNSGALQVGNDRGVRMLPGGNGVGMMCGMNRGMGVPRPGFQGIGSASMLNMVSPGGILPATGMPSPVNMHTGPVSVQGNSLQRPRDNVPVVRPGQNPEGQRHMMMQDFQMQVPQGNCQGTAAPFTGIGTSLTSPTGSSSVQNFPLQHQPQQMPQQSHILNGSHHRHLQGANAGDSQQQAFALRLAKDRQMQQRFMPQQQQFTSSNPSISHPSQPQVHHSVSSMQNGSQTSSPSVSLPMPNVQHPLTQSSSQMGTFPSQAQSKHNHALHGLARSQSGGPLPNQVLKQRQRQQQQQRSHLPQQRQQSNPQQQAKLMKGSGRGNNMMMHQSLPIDTTSVSSLSPGNKVSEKGEPAMQQIMQAQGAFSGTSGSNASQPGRQLVPQLSNPGQHQQKPFSRPHPQKQVSLPQIHVDNSNQGQVPLVQSNQTLFPSQTVPSSPLSRQTSQSQQCVQRILPANNHRHCPPDAPGPGPAETNHNNQVALNSTFAQCTDTNIIASAVSSASTSPSQWKVDSPSYDTHVTGNSPSHLSNNGNMPQQTSTGPEPGQTSQVIGKRQSSGCNTLMHGPSSNDQWPQQSQIQQQHHQQQSMEAGQLHTQPTNSSPG